MARFVFAAAVVAGSAIARGDESTAEMRDLHQKQIAEKSQSERLRLQRNFSEFRKLPAAEQEKLRQFNRELKLDDRNQGGLRAVMAQYHEWLGTLTVGQREDLRKLSDPNMREKRVRELLKEQQEHVESTGPAGGAKAPRGLSSEDLAAVLEVVEQALLSRHLLTEEEKTQLQRKVGLARHMYIVELAYRRPGVPPAQQIGFAPKLGEAMAAGLSNPRQRRFLQSKERPAERSWVLFNLIRAGLMNEYDKKSPDASTLELFFVQLPSDKQDEIMRLPHDRQQQKLTHMYLEKRSEDDPDHYPRPLKPGFWAMQRPPGLRPQGQAGGEPQVRAEGDQPSRENPRKKGNKGSGKKNKAAGGQEDLPDAPEG